MRRIKPDRAALEIAHSMLRTTKTLDEMLRVAKLKTTLYAMARRHMASRDRFDPKKLQSNDND